MNFNISKMAYSGMVPVPDRAKGHRVPVRIPFLLVLGQFPAFLIFQYGV